MQWANGTKQWIEALASANPTPGGGAAAAVAGAMGCALLLMSIRTTLKRKNTPQAHRPLLEKHEQELTQLLNSLQEFAQKDALAYEHYLTSAKLPKEDPSRRGRVQNALYNAALVPFDTLKICNQVQRHLEQVQQQIDPIIMPDVKCARHLLRSAVECCAENVCANADFVTDPELKKELQIIIKHLV